jgi:VWFA-related protein
MRFWTTTAARARTGRIIIFALLFSAGLPAVAQDTTFRSQSNVVLVPTLVRDATGHPVYGLQAQDFILDDNGASQIIHLDESADLEPLSLIVAIQTGREAHRELPRIRGLNSMLGPILGEPQTQIAIVEFDSQVHLEQGFTGDGSRIQAVLQNLEPGDGGAAILDAVSYSVGLLSKVPQGRERVLLLISEIRDHGSHWARIENVVRRIGNSNISIYSLAFSPGLSEILDTERGKRNQEAGSTFDLLKLMTTTVEATRRNTPRAVADQSGGEYELFESRKRFESRMIDFTNHLRSRYLLSFEPENPEPGLHRIHVELRNAAGLAVSARNSYWAESPASSR